MARAPSTRVLVDIAAAQTTTRAGRNTKATTAAKRSVQSEENQDEVNRRGNGRKKTKKATVNLATSKKTSKATENVHPGPIVITGKTQPQSSLLPTNRARLVNVGNSGSQRSYAAVVRQSVVSTGLTGQARPTSAKPTASTPLGRKAGSIAHTQPTARIISNADSYVPAVPQAATVPRLVTAQYSLAATPHAAPVPVFVEGDTDSEVEAPAVRTGLSETESEEEFLHPHRRSLQSNRRLSTESYSDDFMTRDSSPNANRDQFASPAEEHTDARGHVTWDIDERENDSGDDHSTDDDEPGEPSEKRKRNTAQAPPAIKRTRSAVKAGDYDPPTESLLNLGTGGFRSRCVAEFPFATGDEMVLVAEHAWKDARKLRPTLTPCRGVQFSTVLRRGLAQVRGQIRDQARPRVIDCYGFEERPNAVQANVNRYLDLIKDNAFLYADVSGLEGAFYHPLLFKIIKSTFFARSTSDGVVWQHWFNPVRAETIALVCTSIRVCLDEWRTGSYKSVMYTANDYTSDYEVILADLKYVNETDPEFIRGLGQELWEDCMRSYQIEGGGRPGPATFSERKALNAVRYAASRRNQRRTEQLAAAARVVLF